MHLAFETADGQALVDYDPADFQCILEKCRREFRQFDGEKVLVFNHNAEMDAHFDRVIIMKQRDGADERLRVLRECDRNGARQEKEEKEAADNSANDDCYDHVTHRSPRLQPIVLVRYKGNELLCVLAFLDRDRSLPVARWTLHFPRA